MAAPQYSDFANLAQNASFLQRVAVACLKKAQYIIGTEVPTTPLHKKRYFTSQDIITSPGSFASRIMWAVAYDPFFQGLSVTPPASFAADTTTFVTDVQLQPIVETALDNNIFNV